MNKCFHNILIFIIQYSYSVIIFPFKIEPQKENTFIENLFSNNLITIIKIGSINKKSQLKYLQILHIYLSLEKK